MALHQYPNILAENLKILLDPLSPNSNPDGDAVITDLTGNGYNGILYNGATNENNLFQFDGLNDYLIFDGNPDDQAWTADGSVGNTTLCLEFWVKSTDKVGSILRKAWNGGGRYNIVVNHYNFELLVGTGVEGGPDQRKDIIFPVSLSNGVWNHVVVWADESRMGYSINGGQYKDSILHGLSGGASDIGDNNLPLGLMTVYFYGSSWAGITSHAIEGNIGLFRSYNTILSEEEIQQSYLATKSRFEDKVVIEGEWLKVFRQYSGDGDFFSSDNDWEEAKRTNAHDPFGNKYSILDTVEKYKLDGKYTFKINYPQSGITNIWSQTNNPVLDNGSAGVSGYTPISIDTTDNGWGGLERYDAQTSTFLDGTLSPRGNWFYAIGSKSWGGNTTFPGHNTPVNEVELWIKYR